MVFVKKISQPVMPRKRPFDDDDDDDCGLQESRKHRTVVSKYPPPKIRTGVQIVRDFPQGCGVTKYSVGSKAERNPLKNSDDVDFGLGKVTSHDKDKLVVSQHIENNKLKTFKPKELEGNKPSFGSRKTGKVKFWDPNCSKEGDAQKSKDTTTILSPKEQVRREKIKEAMTMFDEVYSQLYQENRSKPKGEKIAHWRVTVEAAKIVKQKKKWMDAEKILGPICGVQIGDKFNFRAQLQMVGLHCQPQSGIDYTKIGGKNLAISIVDSHRYSNERESCDVLFYSGQGGVRFLGSKQFLPEDQKLERGNLALKNSMNDKTPVRVIRKLHGGGKKSEVFVYDGLYIVTYCSQKKGAEGKRVFMFQLNRVPGQPQLHKMLNASSG